MRCCQGDIGAVAVTAPDPPLLGTKSDASNAAAEEAEPASGDAMSQLLNWAVKHSDPDKLKELMEKYKDRNLTLKDVYGQEVLDALFVDESSEMMDMIRQVADWRNTSVKHEQLEETMERLQQFIEQIDNAGNLHRMGGLSPLLDLGLTTERPLSTRAIALWTLGIAVQNNAPVQEELLELDGLRRLATELPYCGGGDASRSKQYCGKLVFAVSGLVKNNASIQADASSLGIFDWLLDHGSGHPALPVAKKCMGLLETVLAQNPEVPFLSSLSGKRDALTEVLLTHVRGESGAEESDTDTAEKALRLITRLLALKPTLFPPSFQKELAAAVATCMQRCGRYFGSSDELCASLQELADSAALMLTARDVTDDEL